MLRYRIPHILKPIKNTSTPTNLFFVDCETRDIYRGKHPIHMKHKLWFGCFIAYRMEKGKRTREVSGTFHTVEELWQVVYKRMDVTRPLHVYAHNAAFDLTILDLWKRSEKEKWNIDFAVLESPPVIISATLKYGRLVFIDTLNYFKCSLKVLGQSLGLEKMEIDIEKASFKEAEPYCKRDVEIIATATERLIQFVKSNRLGKLGPTVASLALSAFRHRFMKHDIYIHDRSKILELEQASYHGGKVNCLYIGKVKGKKIFKYDVNSLYPFVMLKPVPIKLLYSLDNPSVSHVQNELKRYGIVADVLVKTDKPNFPYMKYKELIFPVGTFRTTLCGPELSYGLQNNLVQRCYCAAFYELAPIFVDYVEFFWKLRKEYKQHGDRANETFCKYLLNSLYGKFAQGRYLWNTMDCDTLERLLLNNGERHASNYADPKRLPRVAAGQRFFIPLGSDNTYRVRKVGNTQQIQSNKGWHPESFIAISSYITSYARSYLDFLLGVAGPNHVFYYDTDSLFVDVYGQQRLKEQGLLNDAELGKLKLEGYAYEPTFLSPKDYRFGREKKLKGIRANAKPLTTNTYRQLQFEGLASIIKRGGEPFITISTVDKTVSHNYKKGVVKHGGWTMPYRIVDNGFR